MARITELAPARTLEGSELIEIVQDHGNRKVRIDALVTLGKSAYALAQETGYSGTLEQWLDSLVGPAGAQGAQGVAGPAGSAGVQGIQGPAGVFLIAPVYTQPALTLNASVTAVDTEIGTSVPLVLNVVFAQGDAGAVLSRQILKNGVVSSITSQLITTLVFEAAAETYYAELTHEEGPLLNNNVGTPDPIGQILTGTLRSNAITYIGRRQAFFGTPDVTPSTNAEVRALSASFKCQNNAQVDASGTDLVASPAPSFVIQIPQGAKRVVIAYPASSRALASVRYSQLSNAEVKHNFVESIDRVDVNGANEFIGIAYRVFTYTPVEPFASAVNYKVFI